MVCISAEHEAGVVELYEVQLAIHMALLGRSTVRPSVFPLSAFFNEHLTFNFLKFVRYSAQFEALYSTWILSEKRPDAAALAAQALRKS
jgi:hypothetical protein